MRCALAVAAAVLVLAAVACSSSPAKPLNYVSLGDSFSAGAALPGGTAPCGRGPSAYPSLVATTAKLAATFQACNGATTADVLNGQISSVTAATQVVTISIGGNDIGFAPRIRDCVLAEAPCTTQDAAVEADLAALGPKLAAVYGGIRDRAPGARVFVVGYPQLVAVPDPSRGAVCAGLTLDEARWVREKADELARVIRTSAEAAGAHYLDAAARFAGHEACTADPWMAGVTIPVDNSFHPNATGQQQLAALVEDALAHR